MRVDLAFQLVLAEAAAEFALVPAEVANDFGVGHGGEIRQCSIAGGAVAVELVDGSHQVPVFVAGLRDGNAEGKIRHLVGVVFWTCGEWMPRKDIMHTLRKIFLRRART
jgi:hypothetical protein